MKQTRNYLLILAGSCLALTSSCVASIIKNITVAPTGKALEKLLEARKARGARLASGDKHK